MKAHFVPANFEFDHHSVLNLTFISISCRILLPLIIRVNSNCRLVQYTLKLIVRVIRELFLIIH